MARVYEMQQEFLTKFPPPGLDEAFNSSCVTHLTFSSNYFIFLIRYDTKDPEVCSSAFENCF